MGNNTMEEMKGVVREHTSYGGEVKVEKFEGLSNTKVDVKDGAITIGVHLGSYSEGSNFSRDGTTWHPTDGEKRKNKERLDELEADGFTSRSFTYENFADEIQYNQPDVVVLFEK